jgi:hypothetical protein
VPLAVQIRRSRSSSIRASTPIISRIALPAMLSSRSSRREHSGPGSLLKRGRKDRHHGALYGATPQMEQSRNPLAPMATNIIRLRSELPLSIRATASYLGNKGTDVLTTTYANLVNPPTGVAPYPAFGPIIWRGDVGNSTFHATQFNARRAFQERLSVHGELHVVPFDQRRQHWRRRIRHAAGFFPPILR